MPLAQTARINDSFEGLRARKNSGRNELAFLSNRNHLPDGLSPLDRSERRGFREMPRRPGRCGWEVPLSSVIEKFVGGFGKVGHGQKVRIRLLYPRQVFRSADYSSQALIVKTVGG